MSTKRVQGGFTLIELVVVITILGILAAFAIPRFISLEEQAREASVDAMAGSVRSGAALAHAVWLAQGMTGAGNIPMDGVPAPGVAVNAAGYPTAASIEAVLSDYSGFSFDGTGASGVFTKTDTSGGAIANCTVSYTPDATTGIPSVSVDKGSC